MAGELEIFVVCIKVDAEYLGEVDFTQRIEEVVTLLSQCYVYLFAFFEIMLQDDFSIVHNLENQDTDTEHLGFGRVPPEGIGYFWVQDELEGFSNYPISLLLNALHLLCNPWT